MRKSKFTDQQVAFALQQAETGTPVEELCRKMGVSQATSYRWNKVYGGLMPSEARRLRQLEEENGSAAPVGRRSKPGQGNPDGGDPKKCMTCPLRPAARLDQTSDLRLELLAEPALRFAHEMLPFPSEELSTFPGQVHPPVGNDP